MAKANTAKTGKVLKAVSPVSALDTFKSKYLTESKIALISEGIANIDDVKTQMEKRGYETAALVASRFPISWTELAELRPKRPNQKETEVHKSEVDFRSWHYAMDPTTSPAYSNDYAALLKDAANATNLDIVKHVKNSKGGGALPSKSGDAAVCKAARAKLEAKVKSLGNDVLAARAKEALDAIGNAEKLLACARELANIRSKQLNRRAVLQMMEPIKPVFEKLVPEEKRGTAYSLACKVAKTAYETFIEREVRTPDEIPADATQEERDYQKVGITPDNVRNAVIAAVQADLSVKYGTTLQAKEKPTDRKLLDKFYTALGNLNKAEIVTQTQVQEVVTKMKEFAASNAPKGFVGKRDAPEPKAPKAPKAPKPKTGAAKPAAPQAVAPKVPVITAAPKKKIVTIETPQVAATPKLALASNRGSTGQPNQNVKPKAGVRPVPAAIGKKGNTALDAVRNQG